MAPISFKTDYNGLAEADRPFTRKKGGQQCRRTLRSRETESGTVFPGKEKIVITSTGKFYKMFTVDVTGHYNS